MGKWLWTEQYRGCGCISEASRKKDLLGYCGKHGSDAITVYKLERAIVYTLVQTLSDGLVGLFSERYGRQLWSRCRMRKQHNCRGCKEVFSSGSQMYRPVTNGYNRMERLCEGCIRELTYQAVVSLRGERFDEAPGM